MDFQSQFHDLLDRNKIDEAFEFCAMMQRDYPQFSYYRYWETRLGQMQGTGDMPVVPEPSTKPVAPASSAVAPQPLRRVRPDTAPTGPAPAQLGSAIQQAFADQAYVLSAPPPVSQEDQDRRKSELIKALPYNGAIYLPTTKIPLTDQVAGLERALALCGDANRAVSRARWKRLKTLLRDTGRRRVFVIGNGPSLKQTDLDLLKDEITIGFNGIFLHDTFTPTIHVVEDHLVAEDRKHEITAYHCPVKIFPAYLGYCLPAQENTIFLNHLPRRSFPVDTDFSDDVGEISYTGGTVTYTGLQIAASLGVDEIYLIGVDASYSVQHVERSADYDTGVLTSTADDVNHFDARYFGKGFRWHDPNVHTMLQAYRKARNYAVGKGISIMNATRGGKLEVFPRVDYHDLFTAESVFPKTAIVDFTHIDWLCATGIVKQNLFEGWPRNTRINLHSQNPNAVSAFQAVPNDCYSADTDKGGFAASLRSVLEFGPALLYLRPTHDRPGLAIMQLMLPVILNRPFVVHYMDDWLAKLECQKGPEFSGVYRRLMRLLFARAAKVMAISQKMADYLHSAFDVPQGQLVVAHNFIQDSPVAVMPNSGKVKVLRYFGGMEPDMALASILAVAEAVERINQTDGQPVRFEIYTAEHYIAKSADAFVRFEHTTIQPQTEDYATYLGLLQGSDINLLCYNFDETSETYLRYSMANKLPEIIGADKPFIAIGSPEIGTITYLLEEAYPFVLDRQDEDRT